MYFLPKFVHRLRFVQIVMNGIKESAALRFRFFPVVSKRQGGVSKNLLQNHSVIMIAQRIKMRAF